MVKSGRQKNKQSCGLCEVYKPPAFSAGLRDETQAQATTKENFQGPASNKWVTLCNLPNPIKSSQALVVSQHQDSENAQNQPLSRSQWHQLVSTSRRHLEHLVLCRVHEVSLGDMECPAGFFFGSLISNRIHLIMFIDNLC